MRLKIDARLDYHFPQKADVLLVLEVAQMPDQRLIEDRLTVSTATALTPVTGQQGLGRRIWTAGDGAFNVRYHAVVDVTRMPAELDSLKAVPLRELPGRVIHYLWPSRYCHSEEIKEFANREFGHLRGGAAVRAMADWVRANISYCSGCSDWTTTALDTFKQRQGICRDFAHVMLSFARSLDIPARMVSGYAWNLTPPDFHAVIEVYLQGGWYLVDATGLAPTEGFVRIGVGRDAVDVSFMTVFNGNAQMRRQAITVERLD